MRSQDTAFTGSIPENYDRYLGPVLFEPYAADLVERVKVPQDAKAPQSAAVLELACGTGIVTRRLRTQLTSSVKLVATDLNEAMMAYAARKFQAEEDVAWKQADAADLPFGDNTFDAVVCQFGLMFVPDKPKAMEEASRVLKPGGTFLFSVWDAIEQNELCHMAHTTIATFFEQDPPAFYQVPFSLHDPAAVMAMLAEAGFSDARSSLLRLPSVSPSADEVAKGLVEGNPVRTAIEERNPTALPEIVKAVAAAVAARYGDKPVRASMQAFVFTARG